MLAVEVDEDVAVQAVERDGTKDACVASHQQIPPNAVEHKKQSHSEAWWITAAALVGQLGGQTSYRHMGTRLRKTGQGGNTATAKRFMDTEERRDLDYSFENRRDQFHATSAPPRLLAAGPTTVLSKGDILRNGQSTVNKGAGSRK